MFTRDEPLAALLRSLVNHGMGKRYHYEHVGVNSRLDTLQAALLRVKLKYLEEYHSARRKAADDYDQYLTGLDGIQVPVRSPFSTHVFHQYTLRIGEGRNQLKEYLAARQIPSMIYYPLPLHLQNAYQDLGYAKGDFPVAENLSEQVLSLPMHTELEQEQQAYICEQIINFYK
jgi:dTDP-4-amino-4,6-dideoxygalactose transaminase